MLIHSDWHIHSEASYDATLTMEEIYSTAKSYGFKKVGITDHLNFNDKDFIADIHNSKNLVNSYQKKHPDMILGVELTPIEKPEFDYIAKYGTRNGYAAPVQSTPYGIELGMTKDELIELGVRYAIGASHWRVDIPGGKNLKNEDADACIKEWYRQQMWLACDERVTILGHPWFQGEGLWYEDFSVIPRSMNADIAAALKENRKYVECNAHFFRAPKASEKFRRQYAEFMRELFEAGIPVTYGSDAHKKYSDTHIEAEKYLELAGFSDGDITDLPDSALW